MLAIESVSENISHLQNTPTREYLTLQTKGYICTHPPKNNVKHVYMFICIQLYMYTPKKVGTQ